MSMAIKASKGQVYGSGLAGGPLSGGAAAQYSRRAYMGDPGLFGFLGKAVGTLGRAVGILPDRPSYPPQPTYQQAPARRNGFPLPWPGPGDMRVNPRAALPGGKPLFQRELEPVANGKAPSGYHYNKSDYFLKDGTFVPKGSKLVKNRRRNPLNPRAASRAISRLESAKKATKRLDRISIKCKRCGCSRCKCG